MTSTPLLISAIRIDRSRLPDEAVVTALMQSMKAVGLLNPITLQQHYKNATIYLIAGRNRLEAARRLGWKEIDAVMLPRLDNDPDAAFVGRLAEVSENLHRREIDALERAELVDRWATIVAERQSVSAQVGQKLSDRGRPEGRRAGGVSQTARDLGMPRENVRRLQSIARLAPEAKAAARAAGLADNQAALIEAAKEKTAEAQVELLRRHRSQGSVAKVVSPEEVVERFQNLWRMAGSEAREAIRKIVVGVAS